MPPSVIVWWAQSGPQIVCG